MPIVSDGLRFARLDMTDLAAWCASIKAERRARGTARINSDKSLQPLDRQRAMRQLDNEEIELQEVLSKVYTPAGISHALCLSLIKSGQAKTDEEAAVLLKRMHFLAQRDMAILVMCPPPLEETPPLPEKAVSDTAETSGLNSPLSDSGAAANPGD